MNRACKRRIAIGASMARDAGDSLEKGTLGEGDVSTEHESNRIGFRTYTYIYIYTYITDENAAHRSRVVRERINAIIGLDVPYGGDHVFNSFRRPSDSLIFIQRGRVFSPPGSANERTSRRTTESLRNRIFSTDGSTGSINKLLSDELKIGDTYVSVRKDARRSRYVTEYC